MNIVARLASLASAAASLTACVYAPYGVPAQTSHAFERHPGVFLETSYDGMGYQSTRLVNRSNVDKCAWTDAYPSRLVRAGESWQLTLGQSPGNVGVSDVQTTDPNCANAKRQFGGG